MEVAQVARFNLHKGAVYALSHGADSSTFLSAGSEGIVLATRLNDPAQATVLARVSSQVFALLLIPEKNLLLIGTMAGGFHVFDLLQKREIHHITYHAQSVFDIKLLNDLVLVASKDGSLSVWSADNFSLQCVLNISSMSLRMIDINKQENEIAVACSDNRIYIIDALRWEVKEVLAGPANSVFCVSFIPQSRMLLAGSRDAQLYGYDLQQHLLIRQIKAHLYTINHLQPVANGQFMASASRDKTIRIWDSASLELVKSLDQLKNNGHTRSVNKLLWMPEEQVFLSAGDDSTTIAWSIH
ncbi:MAG: hypothetical protein K1X61_14255 [Chitinophagales bacterium]|nr:hypothetical protein [Chitinophagales bacterium]